MKVDSAITINNPDLKVLTWNIYMLPWFAKITGKTKRAAAIVDQLKESDYDIIVFQEAFHNGARSIIKQGLKEKYPFMYGPANKRSLTKTNSGVWIVSKIPLKELEEISYDDCQGTDCYARKGAMILEGTWLGKTFQIIGTHLQAVGDYAIRKSQCKELYANLLEKFKKQGVPQLICGDMNVNSTDEESYNDMLKTLDAENGELVGSVKVTYSGPTNDINYSTANKQLDYILVRNNGAKVRSIKRKVSIFQKKWGRTKKDSFCCGGGDKVLIYFVKMSVFELMPFSVFSTQVYKPSGNSFPFSSVPFHSTL
jgi:endonuclease/exonuclease/phosphatase family metal-dependent hydrolase